MPVLDEQVHHGRLLADVHRTLAQPVDQRVSDAGPGGVAAGVQDAGVRVSGFQTVGQLAVVAIELHPAGDQLVDRGRAFGAQDADRVGVAEPGAGNERVTDVRRDAVAELRRTRIAHLVDHHGHATLCVAGVALRELGLGQQCDLMGVDRLERRGHAGNSAADHDDAGHLSLRSRVLLWAARRACARARPWRQWRCPARR